LFADCFYFLFVFSSSGLLGVSLNTLNTTDAASTEGRSFSEGDVTFTRFADHEGGSGDDLLSDSDVALEDEATSLVDGASVAVLEDEGLEAAFKNISDGEGQDVIELVLGFFEETEIVATAEEGVTFEDTARVGFTEGKKKTGSTTHLGEDDVDAPDFRLAAETVLTDEAEFTVKTFAFVGTTRRSGDAVEVAVVTHACF
jgi:hypothetical protein